MGSLRLNRGVVFEKESHHIGLPKVAGHVERSIPALGADVLLYQY